MKRLFPSLPETPHLRDVFQRFPKTIEPLLMYHDALLCTDSALSKAERELIAAFVSGLNACTFCFGAHKVAADAFGVDPEVIDALVADVNAAPVDEKLKPLLYYVATLTRAPAMMTEQHAQAVYDAGWSEEALFDAVQVCALFNFMNRIVEGSGVGFDFASLPPMTDADRAKRRARSYTDWGREIGVIKEPLNE